VEGVEEVGGDGDVVGCGGGVDGDDRHGLFIVAHGVWDCVLADGPAALSHPTSEDLLVGPPIRRPHRGVCTLLW
jgi:hypothetical protein